MAVQTVMTPTAAEAMAERTLAAIDERQRQYAADRERIASDLAGLREHVPDQYRDLAGQPLGSVWCPLCGAEEVDEWPCPDARRYSDALLRTAALYGVGLTPRWRT